MKASNSRKALLATLSIALLGLTALVFWQPGLEKPEEMTASGLASSSIERLAVGGPKASPVILQRQEGAWLITSPARLPPDPTQLADLLAAARAPSRASYPLSELDLESTGLFQPLATLEANDVILEFGSRAPISGDRYVRSGTQVHLVSDAHYHTLTQPLPRFVGTRLLPEPNRLQTISLPGFKLRRVAGPKWEIEGDAPHTADAAAIASLWQTAEAAALQGATSGTLLLGQVKLSEEGSAQPILFDILGIAGKPDFILRRADLGLQYHFPPEWGRQSLGEAPIPTPSDARTP